VKRQGAGHRLVDRCVLWLRHWNVFTRFLITFLLLSLIPFAGLGTYAYLSSRKAVEMRIGDYARQIISQLGQSVTMEIMQTDVDSIDIINSPLIQGVLHNAQDYKKSDYAHIWAEMSKTILKRFAYYGNITDAILVLNNGQQILLRGDRGVPFSLEPQYAASLMRDVGARGNLARWIPIDATVDARGGNVLKYNWNIQQQGIISARLARENDTGAARGMLVLRFNESYFHNMYAPIDMGEGARILILNADGRVVSSGDKSEIMKPFPDPSLMEALPKESVVAATTIGGSKFLVTSVYLETPQWFIVGLVPLSYINSETTRMGGNIVGICVLFLLLAALAALLLSVSIVRPLRNLAAAMNAFRGGDASVAIRDGASDELRFVSDNFDLMVRDIDKLMRDKLSEQHRRQEAEYEALQAQINPHFIANTLNSIRQLAILQKSPAIADITQSLATLLKYTFSRDSLIPLGEEIENTRHYVTIQRSRRLDAFDVDYEVDEEIISELVPKLILQPIVENAIIHGFSNLGRSGHISIHGYMDKGAIVLSVADNGVGISKNRLDELIGDRAAHAREKFSGIGVANVDQRIKLLYGDAYGLRIESVENCFTLVEILLPRGGTARDA